MKGLFSFLLVCLSQIVIAQDYSKYNWYFGNSQYGILFNKSDNQPNQTDTQSTPFGNGASAVATDRISGDLLFYTDGLYEGQNGEDQQFGMERVCKLLTEHQSMGVQELINLLIFNLFDFIGDASLDDDITMLGLEILD